MLPLRFNLQELSASIRRWGCGMTSCCEAGCPARASGQPPLQLPLRRSTQRAALQSRHSDTNRNKAKLHSCSPSTRCGAKLTCSHPASKKLAGAVAKVPKDHSACTQGLIFLPTIPRQPQQRLKVKQAHRESLMTHNPMAENPRNYNPVLGLHVG